MSEKRCCVCFGEEGHACNHFDNHVFCGNHAGTPYQESYLVKPYQPLQSPDPLAQIAESLTRLADIAELKLRDGWTSATDTQTIKEIIAKYPRVVISPKVGE